MFLTDAFQTRIKLVVSELIGIKPDDITINSQSDFTDVNRISVDILGNDKVLGAYFTLTELPGCCGVVVSHGTHICPEYRHKGLGKALSIIKQDIAKYWGYSVIICTDVDDNTPQRKILSSNGWQTVCNFINKRTGNLINVDIKPLYDEYTIDKTIKRTNKLSCIFKYVKRVVKNMVSEIGDY